MIFQNVFNLGSEIDFWILFLSSNLLDSIVNTMTHNDFLWGFLCRWSISLLSSMWGFWMELRWIYRFIWGDVTSLWYWVFPSMNMIYILFRYSFMSFNKVSLFSSWRCSILLVRFVSRYLKVFVAMVNGIDPAHL